MDTLCFVKINEAAGGNNEGRNNDAGEDSKTTAKVDTRGKLTEN